jgi:sialate O-acetylesterase
MRADFFLSRTTALALAAAALSAPCHADVRLPALLSSNMVLQANADVALWGWANPNEQVTVTADWSKPIAPVKAGADGKWRITLRTPAYDAADAQVRPLDRFQPHAVVIKGDTNSITLQNILLGEVWVCSGQSNMEMFVGDHAGGYRGVENWQQEARDAKLPGIRLFDVQNTVSFKPEDDCHPSSLDGKSPGWVECSPASVVNFSAVGFFFGKSLHKSLNVPIGLISSDWGGTPAEAWTSEQALKDFPNYAEPLAWMRQNRDGKAEDPMRPWWDKVNEIDAQAMRKGNLVPSDAAYDDSTWNMMTLPSSWSGDLANFDGFIWFRRAITIPPEWRGKDVNLSLGPIDDMDHTFLDGKPVGSMTGPGKWFIPRVYKIPASFATPGSHTIAIRVLDTGVVGGVNGGPETMHVEPADNSADPVPINGYWRFSKSSALSELPAMTSEQTRELNAYTPSALYNGMIAPLTNFAIRGAIWYQGESNRGRADEYTRLFPAMITDWRKQWGGDGTRADFPFYFVQIAPFHYGGDKGETAEIREAQRHTLSLPNTGMAVTMDIGNPADIHPSNKQDVGKRLALWALAKAYAKSDLTFSGPLPKSIQSEGKSLRIFFDHANGLTARGGPARNFEVAGADGNFAPATARIELDSIVVANDAIAAPVAVRYAWCDDCAPNLFNGAGLPASPFRLRLSR